MNQEELNKLPTYEKPHSYHISNQLGAGCFLDPPGYPTYFIQSIYTMHGNEPNYGPTAIIQGHVIEYAWATDETWESRRSAHKKLMDKLYIKPPLNHPRTQEWIRSLYTHFHNCYVDDSLGDNAKKHADKLIIYPVPSYELESYNISKYRKEYKIKELRNKRRDAIATKNDIIISRVKEIAIPKNHAAHRHVIEFYPNAKPRTSLIRTSTKNSYTWYETLSRKPSPEECPGEHRWGTGHTHPVNTTWCQVCGWRKE